MAAPFPEIAIGRRDRAILELLYGTGIRLGECVRTNVADLDSGEALLVRNGKGRKDRVVPLVGRAATALETYLTEAGRELLQAASTQRSSSLAYGRRLSAVGLRATVQRHGRSIGIRVSPTRCATPARPTSCAAAPTSVTSRRCSATAA